MTQAMNINDFVFEKELAFTPEFCDTLISEFEDYNVKGAVRQGHSGAGLDLNIKNTYDLDILQIPELNSKYTQNIVDKFNYYLTEEYLGNLPHQQHFPKTELFYGKTYFECLQIQKYNKGEGHYNAWHIETGNFDMSKRLFVFILYLTDVFEGGETELLYSGLKTQPRKGKLMIAPSTFPYVHKGHMPKDNDKYILTTWLSFVPH